MNEHVETNDGIVIKPSNKMTGKVNIIGKGEEKLSGSIVVKRFSDLSANLNVYSDEIIINPAYPPLVGNQRKAHLSIPNRESLIANIKIPPKNKMFGTIEAIEPPTYYLELESQKDTFVRSSIPTLNYGEAQSMAVGFNRSQGEVFRSLVKFDINQIPENADIKSVSLKLFNSQVNTTTHQVGIYSISTDWLENGTTWVNQPAVKELINIVPLGETGYTDIDVTNIVRDWYYKSQDNHGFLLRAMNESASQYEQFATREAATDTPYLDIEYKLDIIYSTGRSSIESSIFVYAYGESAIKGSINIPQFDDDRNIVGSMHVTNFNLMLEANVKINKPDLYSTIAIKQTKSEALEASVSVRVKGGHLPTDRLISQMTISRIEVFGSINVNRPIRTEHHSLIGNASINRQLVESSITVNRPIHVKHESLTSSLAINRQMIESSVTVRRTNNDNLTGNIQIRLKSEIPAELIINKPSLEGSITVTHYENLSASILVKNIIDIRSSIVIPHHKGLTGNIDIIHASHVPSSISVLSGYLRANIVIPSYGEEILMSKMTVRAIGISEIHGTIYVGGDNILGGYVYIF